MKRNIFITGASSGIGKSMAYSFGKNEGKTSGNKK